MPAKHKKKGRIHSQHAVGASLDPAAMGEYISGYYDEQGKRIDARTKLDSVLANDPAIKADIAHTYQTSVQTRAGNLAAKGLSEHGYNVGDLTDIERDRVVAETAHAADLRAATAEFNSVIGGLNTSRAALDTNFAAIAGQSIKAGTGKFKNEKPKGWLPPSLAGQKGPTTTVDPNTGQPMPAAAASSVAPPPKPPTTLGPTGMRLPTSPAKAVNYAKTVAAGRRALAGRRGRVRLG